MKIRRLDIINECIRKLCGVYRGFPEIPPNLSSPMEPHKYGYAINWDAQAMELCDHPACSVCREVPGWVDG